MSNVVQIALYGIFVILGYKDTTAFNSALWTVRD